MDSPPANKKILLEYKLRADLYDKKTVDSIKSSWTSKSSDFVQSGVEISHDPFTVCIVKNFVNDPVLLNLAAGELKDVPFHQKSNDLYIFRQSDDVRNLTDFTFITHLYDLVRLEGREWVNYILKDINLNEDVSATFSSYGYQDRLLCHDDRCEDRHIAFILYLVEDWNEGDGGSLQFFSSDSNGYPSEIVKSICPEFNMMVFFEVTHNSFHQVSEVKAKTKKRLSLNGWFHSSERKLDKISCKILKIEQNVANNKDFNLEEYFLFTYFDNTNKMDIKKIFSTESEIQLDDFIVSKFFEEIRSDIKSNSIKWITKGPANIRKYEIADTSTLPPSLKTLKEIFQSECWFRYLREITALEFSPSLTSDLKIWEKGILPVCSIEIQRWTNSCYTLIHDQDPEFHHEALDVILRIPFQRRENHEDDNKDTPESGHIIYVDSTSKDEDCLLHIGYKMNSLGLIFRDSKTLRFTKYLDSTSEPFYQVFCTYEQWKSPPDQPYLRHCEKDEATDESVSDDSCS